MFKHSVLNYGSQLGEVRKVLKFSKEDIGLQNLWPRMDVVMLLSSLPQDEYYIAYGSVIFQACASPRAFVGQLSLFFGGGRGKLQMPLCGAGQFIQKNQNCIF